MKKRVRAEDRIGQRFGRLVVVSVAGKNRHGRNRFLCECDCGKVVVIDSTAVVSGSTRSCGCLCSELTATRASNTFKKHGKSASPLYAVWYGMLKRCENIASNSYCNYGGRGITVCERWKSFENFYEDMSPRPSKGHTLDRIDNNSSYCPENCRWATRKEQAKNRRDSVVISYNGVSMVVKDWAAALGFNYSTLLNRLRVGWTVKDALTTPSGVRRANNQQPRCNG